MWITLPSGRRVNLHRCASYYQTGDVLRFDMVGTGNISETMTLDDLDTLISEARVKAIAETQEATRKVLETCEAVYSAN